ncbi:amine oxidase [Streptomyces cinnamoneus]|uniref:Amine oxidase n=1 Tax=Streptomyces cinnamoneus TaxID=53446 RepID=A0A2G1XAF9_STRCJ|nr:NAD(P)/FAD-dependent oxidoreductase [Streptomyces cinnamoneus]PHQ48210.1 amine oxidase [Streptomyces cinnamoneus]PPT15837.1 NAD(P)/FAD-dependent oxidoreductase [Streptomyces cinnamoneus]
MSDASASWHVHTFENLERRGRRVLVIGAGVSGLVAAYELERRGFDVEVLEGNTRIGGRIHTHRFGQRPGGPTVELGAMRIPSHHAHTLEYIRRMGLDGKLRAFSTLLSEENAFLHTDRGFVRIRDAARTLGRDFRHELERHRPGHHHDDATVAFGAWLTAIVDAIAPPDLREALRGDLSGRLLDMVARVDLTGHLRGPARDRVDLHSLFAAHPELRAGCSARLNSFLDDILTETSPDLLRLHGGMDQLTDRLAGRIRGPVTCGRRVTGLDVQGDHVVAHVRAGSRTTVRRADFVVCTVPFPAMRRMRLNGFDRDKRAVLRDVVYCPATKVAVLCRTPFWRESGIQGGASFTGGRIRQTYYPAPDGEPGRGAALLASYTIGDEAARLGRMSARRRHRLVLDELSVVHPELLSPGMVLDVVSMAWGHHPWTGGCTTRWGKNAAECEEERLRAARPVGRLFFAGEHCSKAPAWIEGAIESALEAVQAIERFEPGRRTTEATGRPNPAGAL